MITRSNSYNYHTLEYTSNKAHDGDYNTFYSPKDNAMTGNFLKLYLSQAYSIEEVIMVSRTGFPHRMVNTDVRVYSTVGEEIELASCGTIIGELLLLILPSNFMLQ